MKIRTFYIQGILSLALIAIIGLQLLWLYNMHASYREATLNTITNQLHEAIEREYLLRQDEIGGNITHSLRQKENAESPIKKELHILVKDTTYIVECEINDYNLARADQLSLKYMLPLNIEKLDSILNQLLLKEKIKVKASGIEYYDKETGITRKTNYPEPTFARQNYETDTIFIDILDSVGVKAYVQTSHFAIFQRMLLQLFISIILITAVIICLFRLSSTIFQQQKIEKIRQDFVNAMTHELKRPLSSSVFRLDYLIYQLEENENARIPKKSLEDTAFSLKKLNLYIEKIQEISKGEAGKLDMINEALLLTPFFENMKEQYSFVKEKFVLFNCDIEEGLSLTTDILHFSNVAENLIENSIKYSDDPVRIDITVFKKDNHIHIIHRDDGWGIPASDKSKIFEKFYRGTSSDRREKNGFGLGLSYVKIVVEQMGGEISVDSVEKEYTEFTLVFPC